MIRDIMASLKANPEWRLEVTDESGELIYLSRHPKRWSRHSKPFRLLCPDRSSRLPSKRGRLL